MNTDYVELLGRAHIPLSEKECLRIGFGKKYRAFSVTWPAAMLISHQKRKTLHDNEVQLPGL